MYIVDCKYEHDGVVYYHVTDTVTGEEEVLNEADIKLLVGVGFSQLRDTNNNLILLDSNDNILGNIGTMTDEEVFSSDEDEEEDEYEFEYEDEEEDSGVADIDGGDDEYEDGFDWEADEEPEDSIEGLLKSLIDNNLGSYHAVTEAKNLLERVNSETEVVEIDDLLKSFGVILSDKSLDDSIRASFSDLTKSLNETVEADLEDDFDYEADYVEDFSYRINEDKQMLGSSILDRLRGSATKKSEATTIDSNLLYEKYLSASQKRLLQKYYMLISQYVFKLDFGSANLSGAKKEAFDALGRDASHQWVYAGLVDMGYKGTKYCPNCGAKLIAHGVSSCCRQPLVTFTKKIGNIKNNRQWHFVGYTDENGVEGTWRRTTNGNCKHCGGRCSVVTEAVGTKKLDRSKQGGMICDNCGIYVPQSHNYCTMNHSTRYVHIAWDISSAPLEETLYGQLLTSDIEELIESGHAIKFGLECVADFFDIAKDSEAFKSLKHVQEICVKDMEEMLEIYATDEVEGKTGVADINASFVLLDNLRDKIKLACNKMVFLQKDPLLPVKILDIYKEMRESQMLVPSSLIRFIRDFLIDWTWGDERWRASSLAGGEMSMFNIFGRNMNKSLKDTCIGILDKTCTTVTMLFGKPKNYNLRELLGRVTDMRFIKLNIRGRYSSLNKSTSASISSEYRYIIGGQLNDDVFLGTYMNTIVGDFLFTYISYLLVYKICGGYGYEESSKKYNLEGGSNSHARLGVSSGLKNLSLYRRHMLGKSFSLEDLSLSNIKSVFKLIDQFMGVVKEFNKHNSGIKHFLNIAYSDSASDYHDIETRALVKVLKDCTSGSADGMRSLIRMLGYETSMFEQRYTRVAQCALSRFYTMSEVIDMLSDLDSKLEIAKNSLSELEQRCVTGGMPELIAWRNAWFVEGFDNDVYYLEDSDWLAHFEDWTGLKVQSKVEDKPVQVEEEPIVNTPKDLINYLHGVDLSNITDSKYELGIIFVDRFYNLDKLPSVKQFYHLKLLYKYITGKEYTGVEPDAVTQGDLDFSLVEKAIKFVEINPSIATEVMQEMKDNRYATEEKVLGIGETVLRNRRISRLQRNYIDGMIAVYNHYNN